MATVPTAPAPRRVLPVRRVARGVSSGRTKAPAAEFARYAILSESARGSDARSRSTAASGMLCSLNAVRLEIDSMINWIAALLLFAWLGACSGSDGASVGAQGGAAGSSAGGSATGGASAGGSAMDASATGGAGAAGTAGASGSPGVGGSHGGAGSGGASGGTSGAAGSSGAAGADGGPSVVQCNARPQVFPGFDRACSSAGGCFVALHQTDCCGTQVALGISLSEQDSFTAAEATCRSQYIRCACPPAPTKTDTGQITPSPQQIAVDCRAQVCTTFVP